MPKESLTSPGAVSVIEQPPCDASFFEKVREYVQLTHDSTGMRSMLLYMSEDDKAARRAFAEEQGWLDDIGFCQTGVRDMLREAMMRVSGQWRDSSLDPRCIQRCRKVALIDQFGRKHFPELYDDDGFKTN